MNTLSLKDISLIKHHNAIKAHIRFLINAVGKLDLQSCKRIADPAALKKHIALYRWSLNDFKEAVQRHIEIDKRIFADNPSLTNMLKDNQKILEMINSALALTEKAAGKIRIREELNVLLVKTNLAVNILCVTMKASMAREEEITKKA